MIKTQLLILILLLLNKSTLSAQILSYFTDKDSVYVGLKSEEKIIVPLGIHKITYNINFSKSVPSPIIELPGSLVGASFPKESPVRPAATIYNSNGEPLYYTLFFDNGSDYFIEDAQRIISISNHKVGLADDEGHIIVPPAWDFAYPFNYGYAKVFLDVKKDDVDTEYWTIAPASPNSFSGYVNKKGELTLPSTVKNHQKDYILPDSTFLPYPFVYNNEEQNILKRFELYEKIINDISMYSYYTNEPKSQVSLQFEIIRKPSKHFPYYKIEGYRKQLREDYLVFLYNATTDSFYYLDYPYSLTPENIKPIKEYIVEKLDQIREYEKKGAKHSPMFPFDIEQAYQKWNK